MFMIVCVFSVGGGSRTSQAAPGRRHCWCCVKQIKKNIHIYKIIIFIAMHWHFVSHFNSEMKSLQYNNHIQAHSCLFLLKGLFLENGNFLTSF